MKRVLFVCLGNICRSPLAHGLAKDWIEKQGLGDRLEVDSCGTSSYHRGEQADPNSRAVARAHGVDLDWHRSRPLRPRDYRSFDVLVAMDAANERDIRAQMPEDASCAVVRFMDYVPGAQTRDVPDPYYGGRNGFEAVHGLVESGIEPLLRSVLSD